MQIEEMILESKEDQIHEKNFDELLNTIFKLFIGNFNSSLYAFFDGYLATPLRDEINIFLENILRNKTSENEFFNSTCFEPDVNFNYGNFSMVFCPSQNCPSTCPLQCWLENVLFSLTSLQASTNVINFSLETITCPGLVWKPLIPPTISHRN